MKKTLAFVLTLALILSSVITFSVGATLTSVPTETITVDGVVTDNGWAADGWTNVAKDTGWFQHNSIDTDFDYDYQYRIDSTNIYFAFKFNQAPRWTSTTQTGATNLRLWIDSTPADAARTNLFDFTYDKADGATSIIKETKDNGATTGLVCAATEGADYLYIEVSIPLASLGVTSATSVKFLFTGSQDNIYNTAAVVDDPETTEVDETAAAVYKYDALHSLDSTLENKGDYWKDSAPWPAAVTLGDFKLAGSYVNNTAYLKIDSANITHRVDG
ncbi:MAG TPA: hypothetical protein PLT66_03465, partial [Bacillota bacterium]|nr:hypothetical protein [Bacillota bacterium]